MAAVLRRLLKVPPTRPLLELEADWSAISPAGFGIGVQGVAGRFHGSSASAGRAGSPRILQAGLEDCKYFGYLFSAPPFGRHYHSRLPCARHCL
jgi:hypothetical protein